MQTSSLTSTSTQPPKAPANSPSGKAKVHVKHIFQAMQPPLLDSCKETQEEIKRRDATQLREIQSTEPGTPTGNASYLTQSEEDLDATQTAITEAENAEFTSQIAIINENLASFNEASHFMKIELKQAIESKQIITKPHLSSMIKRAAKIEPLTKTLEEINEDKFLKLLEKHLQKYWPFIKTVKKLSLIWETKKLQIKDDKIKKLVETAIQAFNEVKVLIEKYNLITNDCSDPDQIQTIISEIFANID